MSIGHVSSAGVVVGLMMLAGTAAAEPVASGGAAASVSVGFWVKNFHKVDDRLYRGAQPDRNGLAALKRIGVRTVVNLRTDDTDSAATRALGLNYYHIPMSPWKPSESAVVRFLEVVARHQGEGAIFVHCRQGADRTGMMVAVYRVTVSGWSRERAVDEMTEGDFNHHSIYRSLRQYVRRVDASSLRSQAGLDLQTESQPVLADTSRSPLEGFTSAESIRATRSPAVVVETAATDVR